MTASSASLNTLTRSMSLSNDDPLSLALRPPPNETKEQRTERLKSEAEAKRISDAIDEELKAERAAKKKKKHHEVAVLLLGQSESGKSSLAKQFQIMYTPTSFREELSSWRPVIYLNIVRSVLHLIDAVSIDSRQSLDRASLSVEELSLDYDRTNLEPLPHFNDVVQRLEPLYALERTLISIVTGSDEVEATGDGSAALSISPPGGRKEYFVRASAWRKAIEKLRGGSRPSLDSRSHTPSLDEPVAVLSSCKADIEALWKDPALHEILDKRRLVLQHGSGFFLDDIDRIVAPKYMPTPQDVLNARLKTMGVIEHVFSFTQGVERGVDWKIFDVGGARNQRATWIPFFDFVDAIIFLAPISAFDEVLAEDPDVNRVEDSVLLFRAICGSKLLANVNVILFLNKCDILKAKLAAGVQVNKYVLSYKGANDFESVSKYFRSKFAAVHRDASPAPRDLYVHLTSVTDTQTMTTIINNVRDVVLRRTLSESQLM